jgi:hypothetical protein
MDLVILSCPSKKSVFTTFSVHRLKRKKGQELVVLSGHQFLSSIPFTPRLGTSITWFAIECGVQVKKFFT